MSTTSRSRIMSGRTAQFFVAAELTRRNYKVNLAKDSRSTGLTAESETGGKFQFQCRNRMRVDMSWVIERFKPDSSLYFVLVFAELEQPYAPPQYWTVPSKAMKDIFDAYMIRNPSAKSANVYADDVKRFAGLAFLPA